nr:Fic family protein [Clostridia bacterium]
MFEEEINKYESVLKDYRVAISSRMDSREWMEYNEILFSAHSCAIEGNTFTVDDSRILRENGLGMVPVGRSLFECMEMADHFRAFDHMVNSLGRPFDERLLKEINKLVTEHTLPYKVPGAVPGEYTTEDMAAGDTVFGEHEKLVAQVPKLMSSTEKAMSGTLHPIIIAARWHGFFEYLHPFRDGNGRTGRLMSNFILLKAGHPLLIIQNEDRTEYIAALRQIRLERTDEHLVSFFFKTSTMRMERELYQKKTLSERIAPFEEMKPKGNAFKR